MGFDVGWPRSGLGQAEVHLMLVLVWEKADYYPILCNMFKLITTSVTLSPEGQSAYEIAGITWLITYNH